MTDGMKQYLADVCHWHMEKIQESLQQCFRVFKSKETEEEREFILNLARALSAELINRNLMESE